MNTRELGILVLRELKRQNAHAQPVDSWKFSEEFIYKNLTHEQVSVVLGRLESKKFIRAQPKGGTKLGFVVWLDNSGIEEIDNFDKEVEEKENAKEIRNSDFKRSLISTSLGLVLGGIISWILLQVEKPTQVFPIIHMKTRIVHDTIYIASPNKRVDTSLIRIVKLPINKPKTQ